MPQSKDSEKYILYVDDDIDDIRQMADGFLLYPEYTLLTFQGGIDLLSYLDKEAYHMNIYLVISDINMPAMNGLEFIRQLHANSVYKNIPAVFYSTAKNPLDKMIADAMHTPMFLKPFSEIGLGKVIDQMLIESHKPSA